MTLEAMDDKAFSAWLAGFFDGEGHVRVPPRTGISIVLANTNEQVIRGIHQRLGYGQIQVTTFDNPKWRPKYVLRVQRYFDAERFLNMVRPYLTIKAGVTDTALLRIRKARAVSDATRARNAEIV